MYKPYVYMFSIIPTIVTTRKLSNSMHEIMLIPTNTNGIRNFFFYSNTHSNAKWSYRQRMRGTIKLAMKVNNIDKVEIIVNLLVQPIGENAMVF